MQDKPSVLALIPARGNSKGIPRKNIRSLAGRPLLQYSCECALASRLVTRTIVSTDCPKTAQIALRLNVDVPFLRPAEFATDESPTTDVIRHLLAWLRDNENQQPEVVVLLQPTAPLRTATDVDLAIGELIRSDDDSVVSVCSIAQHFHPEWQFVVRDGQLKPYATDDITSVPTRRQLLQPTYSRNGAIYAFWRTAFETHGTVYGKRCRAFPMPSERSINIDTPEDWQQAESYLSQHTWRAA